MDDLYATSSDDVLRHTLEHLEHTVALKVEQNGCTGEYEHLKRLCRRRGDAFELRPNPTYLESLRLSLVLDRCKKGLTPTQFGQKEEADEHELLPDREKWDFRSAVRSSSCLATDHHEIQHEVDLLAQFMLSPANGTVRRKKKHVVRYAVGMRDQVQARCVHNLLLGRVWRPPQSVDHVRGMHTWTSFQLVA